MTEEEAKKRWCPFARSVGILVKTTWGHQLIGFILRMGLEKALSSLMLSALDLNVWLGAGNTRQYPYQIYRLNVKWKKQTKATADWQVNHE